MDFGDITDLQLFGGAGGAMLALALIAGVLDRRQGKRRNLDAIGLVNWRPVSAIALMFAIVLLSVAAKIGLTS